MAVDFALQLYLPNYDLWARPVTFFPIVSQPGVTSYEGRGIYDSNDLDFDSYGEQIISDARIELDILAMEFTVVPMQGDQLRIVPWMNVPGGSYEISDISPDNAGGEMTLVLRRLVPAKGPSFVLGANAYSLGALEFGTPDLTVT